MALVEVEQLTYAYGSDTATPRLRDCSLTVEPGEMVLVAGPSGCGKSTLLRAINGLVPHFHGGMMSGRVRLAGIDTRESSPAQLAHIVACVFQDPEAQIVSSTVFEEVAFGLESLGFDPQHISLRVHEALGAMGISHLAERSTRELSGGEMQRVTIASALATGPALLLLDEPTSQLDPAAAEGLLELLRRVNEDSGIAVVIAEHRLERCFHWADRVVVMEDGRILSDTTPRKSAEWSVEHGNLFVPPVTRLLAGFPVAEVPLTVKEGRAQVRAILGHDAAEQQHREVQAQRRETQATQRETQAPRLQRTTAGKEPTRAIIVRDLHFTYPDGFEALRGCSLTIGMGECVSIMGENGAGKSTLVRHFNGLNRAKPKAVSLLGRDVSGIPAEQLARTCAVLGQNPNDYLFCDTVADELRFSLSNLRPDMDESVGERAIASTLATLAIDDLTSAEPRALSAGQRHRVAIAAMTVADPDVLVLDEPTRGLDWESKSILGACLRKLQAAGKTIVAVTHDIEFVSAFTDRTIVMGAGRIIADGPAAATLGATTFLAPQVSRVMGEVAPGIVTVDAGRAALKEAMARG